MPHRNRRAERATTDESKFYLPAGTGPSLLESRIRAVWKTLFNHQVGRRR
ncbi:hypothetical protein [Halobellus ruber]|uniref:Uncharacterized protein n=1 Tax=Halobellus ruber TaxID=2761102 RepID=A0A7J9SL21_9EURY|nr:hypothetical protein [Halobellus ruber]MBB6647398.1 hypothetical protein [Halobellus ruber]